MAYPNNKIKIVFAIVFVLSILTSCQQKEQPMQYAYETVTIADTLAVTIKIDIQDTSATLYAISNTIESKDYDTSTWELPYPVYEFEKGDIDCDGIIDICVGVIKPTRFDPIERERLFIFKLYKGRYIRPMWLGSRMSMPLQDFKIQEKDSCAVVKTIEIDKDGSYIVGIYKWMSFGLQLEEYVAEGLTLEQAHQTIIKKTY